MKKVLLLIGVTTLLFTACSKDGTNCYECDTEGNGQYTDAGCMDRDQWNNTVITDPLGAEITKSERCRIKR